MASETPEAPIIEARLYEPREGAGQLWWGNFLQKRAAQIDRRTKLAGILYWTPSVNMPLDLFSYIREAALCFEVARFLSTIVLSSSAVELILNRDRRTRHHAGLRKIGGWATLNNQNLAIAGSQGLPVGSLISAGESLADAQPLKFVTLRNKVAHGEIFHMFRTLTDYDQSAEDEALDQLAKSQRFVVDWFNSAPDVQESHIQNHRWPGLA
jgi:hypothetical protein